MTLPLLLLLVPNGQYNSIVLEVYVPVCLTFVIGDCIRFYTSVCSARIHLICNMYISVVAITAYN